MHDTIDKLKNAIRDTLEKYGVKKAALFGSVIRGEALEDSDIDLLVEFEPGKSLLDLARLKLELEGLLKRKVDIVTYRSLHPLLKERILSSQIEIR
jgi:predicted nucleotidyltransferase